MDEYRLFLDHVEKLVDRRHAVTTTFLSVNAAVLAALAFLFKDSPLDRLNGSIEYQVAALLLLAAAGIACWLWVQILGQYRDLLDWWYARLRELEAGLPEPRRLLTREHAQFYAQPPTQRALGLSQQERNVALLFMALYALAAVGLLVAMET